MGGTKEYPLFVMRCGRRAARTRRGFLLAEIVIAAFVFAACFATAISLIHSARAQLRAAPQELAAWELAQTEIERIRSQLPRVPANCVNRRLPVSDETLPEIVCTVTVQDFSREASSRKRVTVQVGWRPAGRPPRTARLSTLIHCGPAPSAQRGGQKK